MYLCRLFDALLNIFRQKSAWSDPAPPTLKKTNKKTNLFNKRTLSFGDSFGCPLLLIFVILSFSVLCRRIPLPLLPGAHTHTHTYTCTHTHTHTRLRAFSHAHTHTQYGQHTQASAVHSPLLVLMNGPSLNYFVQISFRPLKKRSCLFIHFTFAPGLQYLRLCLQRIYPPPLREGEKKKKEKEKKL